jgi:hypothetical protein
MTYLIQPSFTGGEFSPTLYSRVDIEKFQTGAKTIKNFIVDQHGGVYNRAGTYFVGEVYNSSYESRLVPFQFSVTQAYALEFSELKMRVIKDGGLVTDSASSIVSFTTPWSSSELADLDFSQSADVLYAVHPDHFPYKISRTAHDVWSIDKITYEDGPYASNTIFDFDDQDVIMQPDSYYSSTVTITSPQAIFKATMDEQRLRLGYFDPEDITNLTWRTGKITSVTDSATVVVDFSTYREPLGHAFNKNYRFDQGLSEWEDNSSGTSTLTFYPGTYARLTKGASGNSDMRQKLLVPQNTKAVMVFDLAGISAGQVKISIGTTSGATDIMSEDTINATGTTITEVTIPASLVTGSTQTEVWMNLTNAGSASGNTADIALYALITKEKNTNQWRVPAWTDDTGYPRAVTFHEQRLIYASSVEEPNTFWLSKTADFENFGFSSPLADDDGFQFALASRQLNDIRWMIPFTSLLAGTSGSEWEISSGENSDAITPTSIAARPQSYIGSADLKPIIIENAVVFVQRGANAVHDTKYSLESDSFETFPISSVASHLFDGKQVVSWAYARNPNSVIWLILDDGSLIGVTYVRAQNITAWHHHVTDGEFESVCVIPGSTGSDDVTYFVVKRTIDSVDYRYIEQLMPRITDEDTYDYFFVDSGLSAKTSSAITTISLPHLVGETVSILANGSVLPQQVVDASGTVTISVSAKTTGTNIVHAGLPYTSDLQTLDVELADQLGVSQGRKKTIPRVAVSLYKSRGMQIGPDENNLDEVGFRTLADGENPIALYTGDKTKDIPAGYETKGGLFIRNSDPIPLTVLAIMPEIELSDA